MGHINAEGRLLIIEKIVAETELSDSAKLVAISAVIQGGKPLTDDDVRRGQQLESQLIRDFE